MKKKYLIVVADYYKDIAKGLLDSALKLIPKSNTVKIIKVPGVFEIPVTISKNIKRYDAFLALGCVIKVKHHILILYHKLQLMRLWIYQSLIKNLLVME